MIENNIMVSIWCLTYNHLGYIKDAIDGFLSQKTDFKYKVVIYDDASTDGTSDIIREYAERYPDIIETVIEPRNRFHDSNRLEYMLGLMREKLTGKYIALCEGDDFWIDCQKLQRQVDYMEHNQNCSLCMHNAVWMDYSQKRFIVDNGFDVDGDGRILKPAEIIRPTKGHPSTASFLFKKEVIWKDDFFFKAPIGDYPLQLAALTCGYIYYSSRVMSVYRWMTSGSYNDKLDKEESLSTYFGLGSILFLSKYDKYTDFKYHEFILDKMNMFAAYFIEHSDLNKEIDEIIKNCQQDGYNLDDACRQFIPWLEKLRLQMRRDDYIADTTRDFLAKHKHIWIMGTGRYASVFAKQMEQNEIKYEGFAVSNTNENPIGFFGKKVVNLLDIPEKDSVGVIVAVLPTNRNDLSESLNHAGIEHFYNPFDIKI